jgi:predicted MFS family arabinose efflux permease
MLCGYYFEKVTSAIKPELIDQAKWTSEQFGFFRFSYGWVTVFMGGLVIGGIILDKKGVRFSGILACIMMVLGAGLCGYAIFVGDFSPLTVNLLVAEKALSSIDVQVWVASFGFAIFCMGDELAGITVSKVIVKWFKGKELATAMGLEMAAARMGSGIAIAFGLPLAAKFGLAAPVLIGTALLGVGMLAFIFYTGFDKRLDSSEPPPPQAEAGSASGDDFKFSDILEIFKNQGFWLIAILCVLFYSAVFPYLDYATDLMVQKFGFSKQNAGYIPALLPFGTILLTPIFGNIYDRKGKGASIMALGAVILIVVHSIFSVPAFDHWGFAVFAVLLLGIGFSLVPSAMWPSVPKLIPEKQLGTAYALIFFIQNIGLMGVPYLIGWVLDKYCIIPGADAATAEAAEPLIAAAEPIAEAVEPLVAAAEPILEAAQEAIRYDYTYPMMIFTLFGILALGVALMLRVVDGKKGYGLEMPNIKK